MRIARAALLLPLLLLTLPAAVQAQYNYTTNSPDTNTITITKYTGPGGAVIIPTIIDVKTVTSVGGWIELIWHYGAFDHCTNLTSVTIPSSVTSIGDYAFLACNHLTNVVIGDGVTSIGNFAFEYCAGLTSITIPENVMNIGGDTFAECTGLTSVTIASGVTNIGDYAFDSCPSLRSVYFKGNAPNLGLSVFNGDTNATIYHLFSTTGWSTNVGGLPTAVWTQQLTVTPWPTQDGMATGSGTYAVGTNVQIVATASNGWMFMNWSDGATNNPYGITMPETNITYRAYFGAFTYTTNFPDTNTITITRYNGPGVDVVIPDAINALTVTCIGSNAFYWWGVTSVKIPDSVTNIGYQAFYHCTWMTNVIIPESVISIGDYAFCSCTFLRNVAIPNGVASIGIFEFTDCTSLTNVTIPNGVANIGLAAFNNCTSLTTVTIPNSVTNIADFVFGHCTSLTGVYFKGNAPTFGASVFQLDNSPTVYHTFGTTNWGTTFGGRPTALWTQQLTVTANPTDGGTVTGGGTCAVGTNVQLVATASNGWVFANWNDGGTNNPYVITMPETNITYTANFAVDVSQFTYTTNGDDTITITGYTGSSGTITIPSTINGLAVGNIGAYAFYGYSGLTSLMIPDGVTNIGMGAFETCTNLTNVKIPDSVTSIGTDAFVACSNLTNVTIPDGVISIGDNAFAACRGLTNITIPDSVTTIGIGAFGFCSSLTSVTLPNSITNIANVLFGECTSLTNVTIPNSVTTIGTEAFTWCTSLVSITLPDGITSIGDLAFEYCPALTNIVIPNSVTSIGESAFWRCSSMSKVTVGDGVTNIGNGAFQFCTNLTGVYFRGNAPAVGSTIFANADSVAVYYLPGTTNWGPTLGDCPTAVWRPQMPGDASFGLQSNQFGFNINWASGMVVVVEASTNLTGSSWDPLQTNTLSADSSYFSDLNWTNYSVRFYRIRWE
jgi:hypothetical protein